MRVCFREFTVGRTGRSVPDKSIHKKVQFQKMKYAAILTNYDINAIHETVVNAYHVSHVEALLS